jgi:hypothetical protein
LSSSAASTFAAAGWLETALGLSRIRAIASAAWAKPGRDSEARPPTSTVTPQDVAAVGNWA